MSLRRKYRKILTAVEIQVVPKGTIVYRGWNSRQKKGGRLPRFFAMDPILAATYSHDKDQISVYKVHRDLHLVRNDYPIEQENCPPDCLPHAEILLYIAEKEGLKDVIYSIKAVMQDSPDHPFTDAFKVDIPLVNFFCSLGFQGWIRPGEAPEITVCYPWFKEVRYVKKVRKSNDFECMSSKPPQRKKRKTKHL